MAFSQTPLRRVFPSCLVISLLITPAIAAAAGLCLQDANGRQYVLNKVSAKIASAKAKPFGGVSVFGGSVRPLSGVATKSSDGQVLSLAFTLYEADVSNFGFSISGASEFHQIALAEADKSWDIGDAALDCFWEGGVGAGAPACMGINAIDCSAVVLP